MQTVNEALDRLSRSAFRSRFRLTGADLEYIDRKGLDTIRSHARDFVRNRLAPAEPENDGSQTPMRGHPVFVAMHATACCCRGCLCKWYHVEKGVPLTDAQQEKITGLIMAWIERQMNAARTDKTVRKDENGGEDK